MTTTDSQPAPHELLREEFCALAKAVRLSNHGRRWNVELAACRTFPLAGRIAHRSWNLTV